MYTTFQGGLHSSQPDDERVQLQLSEETGKLARLADRRVSHGTRASGRDQEPPVAMRNNESHAVDAHREIQRSGHETHPAEVET